MTKGNSFLLSVGTLWLREMVRFYRQPSRILGALGTPFVFWLLIGAGIGSSFRTDNYLFYFFPGTVLMILLFTAVFSTISLIEDRREGFLQSVLVAPVPREILVLGKILGGTTLALIQGFIFLILGSFFGISLSVGQWFVVGFAMFLNALALTGLGFIVAWRLQSIQGFHAVMNLFLMPLWFLSGALFPPEGAPLWIQMIMKLNPLSYGMAILRMSIYGVQAKPAGFPGVVGSTFLAVTFAAAIFILASFLVSRRRVEDLA